MNFATIRQSDEWAPRCASWLDQFEDSERPIAEKLLDSVSYISHEEVCNELQQAVDALVESASGGAIALYPVTNTRKFAAFGSYQELPFGLKGDLGSEGDVGHLCRDIAKQCGPSVLAFPGLHRLKSKRVRRLVLLTDSVGSGQQVLDFLSWVWADRTVRSWHSSGLVRCFVVSYLFTDAGRATCVGHKSKPTFEGLRACEPGREYWSADERGAIERLCRKYGAKQTPLGFADSFLLEVFAYSCPNNVPSILRFGNADKRFRGLFERRPSRVSAHVMSGTQQSLGTLSSWLGITASKASHIVCYCLLSKSFTASELSRYLALALTIVNRALREASQSGFVKLVGRRYKLTRQGVVLARSLASRPDNGRVAKASTEMRFDYISHTRSPASSSSLPPIDKEAP